MTEKQLKVIKNGDVFRWDFGHGEELVKCAGRAPKMPEVIGFYTEDGGLFVVKETNLGSIGLKYAE